MTIRELPPSKKHDLRIEYEGKLYLFKDHAITRMEQRGINPSEVVYLLANEVWEKHKPEARYTNGAYTVVARCNHNGWVVVTLWANDLEGY